MINTNKLKGHSAICTANILWGAMSPAAKMIFMLSTITPVLLVDLRVIGGAVLCWAASLFTKHEHVPGRDLIKLFFASLLCIVFNQGLYIIGLGMTSPIDATIITTTTPIFTMILAAVVLKDRITWMKSMGLAIGAAGALLLILGGHSSDSIASSRSLAGDLLCLGSKLSFALYFVFFRDIIQKYSPITLMKWMFTFAILCILPLTGSDLFALDIAWSAELIGALAAVIAGGTWIGYLLTPIGQKYLPPTAASMYCYVQPAVASLIVIFYMQTESMTWMKFISMICIFAGVYLVTHGHAPESLPPKS